jgi:hypothetical protein
MYETNTGSASPPVEPGKTATGAVLKQSAGDAKAEVKDLAHQAQIQARDLAQQAQSQAKQLVETRKSAVADTLTGVARALDSTAQSLESEQQSNLSSYARSVSSSIERFSSGIRDKDLVGIKNDAERFARAQPALFIGGCVALGFALSRFLKATEKPREQSYAGDAGIENEPGFAAVPSTYSSSQESWDEPMGTSGAADELGVTTDASGAGGASSLQNAGDTSNSSTNYTSSFTTPWADEVKR